MTKKVLSIFMKPSFLENETSFFHKQGIDVISTATLPRAFEMCSEYRFDLIVVGCSIPSYQRRYIAEAVRVFAKVPTIVLHDRGALHSDVASDCAYAPEGAAALVTKIKDTLAAAEEDKRPRNRGRLFVRTQLPAA
jgi:hypothetical protein